MPKTERLYGAYFYHEEITILLTQNALERTILPDTPKTELVLYVYNPDTQLTDPVCDINSPGTP